MDLVRLADQLGYHSVWTAEAYGSDAISPLAWIGAQTSHVKLGTAIMQIPARTPAMTAMTAMTLDQLSGGRMLLGLGLSGPQVVEGWHGQAYGKPLVKSREFVSIVREIFARETPLSFEGEAYQIPYHGPDATGLGKPLKSILHGRKNLPIYLAAIGPKNVELAAEIADGWLPILFAPRHYNQVFAGAVQSGLATSGRDASQFDIAPSVTVVLGDDVDLCRSAVKPMLALYIGGMGAKGKNFYNDLVRRYGYGAAADQVQSLYLSGRRDEAAAAIPDALVDEVALCGPRERIRDGMRLWHESPVGTLIINTFDPQVVSLMAELVLESPAPVVDSPPAPPPEGVASVGDASASQMFDRLAQRLADEPQLSQRVNAAFEFHLSGESGGVWLLDLRQPPGVVVNHGADGFRPDCKMHMAAVDFVELIEGRLNPIAAYTRGKLKIEGNMMVATKLQSLFS
jgi:F420-dependent oxidoreductase-like protein